MALPNPSMSFTPFDILTAAEMNDLVENIEALANWTAFAAASLPVTILPAGVVIQEVITQSGAVATGTTIIPTDDTIPQITEGTEFMTRTITPKSATNRLLIEVKLFGAVSAVQDMIVALFQGATANALAAAAVTPTGNGYMQVVTFTFDMIAGSTSLQTFRVRGGPAGAATITFNGVAGARKFGGVASSSIKITEYRA